MALGKAMGNADQSDEREAAVPPSLKSRMDLNGAEDSKEDVTRLQRNTLHMHKQWPPETS